MSGYDIRFRTEIWSPDAKCRYEVLPEGPPKRRRLTGPEIVDYARTLKGTPYQHQGRLPGHTGGIDCIGVPICIARHFGWPYREIEGYSRKPDGKLEQRLREQMDEIAIAHADEGDILCMEYDQPGIPAHVALLTDYGILHAIWLGRRAPNRVHETVFSKDWRDRVLSAFRFRQG